MYMLSCSISIGTVSGFTVRSSSKVSISSIWKEQPSGSWSAVFRFSRSRCLQILRALSSVQRLVILTILADWRRPRPLARSSSSWALRCGLWSR